MTIPVLTFFNNKGGVGKTSLVFHVAWMLSEMGKRVVAIDLDPQANLTSAFLTEDDLEALWDPPSPAQTGTTIFECVRPLTEVGDILAPQTQRINSRLHLVPGDLALAGFEDTLSQEWPKALDSGSHYRSFRILSSFWQVAQQAAEQHSADIILADVGPNLGAINRSALIATDHVVIPLAADLFSLQGLRNLGPTLRNWRADWCKRLENWPVATFPLPRGAMSPVGYILMQHSERLSRPVKAYKKWADRIPSTYEASVLGGPNREHRGQLENNCLAQLKHYRSLVPMALEVRKPVFQLTAADGAIGNHAYAVKDAWSDFKSLTVAILERISLPERQT
jgi:cellulose biosynthesis protein BcsQ